MVPTDVQKLWCEALFEHQTATQQSFSDSKEGFATQLGQSAKSDEVNRKRKGKDIASISHYGPRIAKI